MVGKAGRESQRRKIFFLEICEFVSELPQINK